MQTKKQKAKHVAIIMDGNGRWANERKLKRYHGHSAGATSVKNAINAALKNNLEYLTVFALSSENILRPQSELIFLKNIFYKNISDKLGELHKNQIKIKFIGDLSYFEDKILNKIKEAELLTRNNKKLVFTVALNYGGRWDVIQACNRILLESKSNPDLISGGLNEAGFSNYLSTADIPDPDLLIRTGGYQRISNFLNWQLSYTELYFSDKYWPDFSETDFEEALKFYYNSSRNFGLAEEKVE